MTENSPHRGVVKHNLLLINIPFQKNGIHDVHRQVGQKQEHETVVPNFSLLKIHRVGAAPQAIHNKRGLDQHLDYVETNLETGESSRQISVSFLLVIVQSDSN